MSKSKLIFSSVIKNAEGGSFSFLGHRFDAKSIKKIIDSFGDGIKITGKVLKEKEFVANTRGEFDGKFLTLTPLTEMDEEIFKDIANYANELKISGQIPTVGIKLDEMVKK